ncbi:MAG: two-component system sensor histidine kinase NtrB [Candidatus Entotheonellia bacterium]
MRGAQRHRVHGRVLSATFIGAVFTLLVILCFYAYRQIERERERMLADLRLKGTTLVHSLEAGARVGMVGMMGGRQQLQTLLEEAARDPEILVIEVINEEGKVLGSTQRTRVGTIADNPRLGQVLSSGQLLTIHEGGVFQLLAPFRPSTIDVESARRMQEMMRRMMGRAPEEFLPPMNLAIRVDLSMARVEGALREEVSKAILTALICFSGGAAALYFILLAQDYRSVKRALQEMRTYMQHVVESMADGLLSVDVRGHITTGNPKACQLLGLSPADIEGRPFAEIFGQIPLALEPVLRRGLPLEEREIAWGGSNGGAVPLAVSMTPLTGDQGEVAGAVVLLRDLRTLKALQERVERTERLAALGRLAAGVAHEIRNPLGAIRGLVQHFQATWKDDVEQRGYLDVIVREVDRLNRVVSDLVEFARPREAQQEPRHVVEIVRHAVTLMQSDVRAKGIQIVCDLPETLPPLLVDRDMLLQALLNILLNAIEAMEPGGMLAIRLADAPAWVELAIQDTGRGIAPDHLGRLFDPFFTTKQQGTGLGLAIAHRVIHAHDGEIVVDSAPGQGTTVTIRLPKPTAIMAGGEESDVGTNQDDSHRG